MLRTFIKCFFFEYSTLTQVILVNVLRVSSAMLVTLAAISYPYAVVGYLIVLALASVTHLSKMFVDKNGNNISITMVSYNMMFGILIMSLFDILL